MEIKLHFKYLARTVKSLVEKKTLFYTAGGKFSPFGILEHGSFSESALDNFGRNCFCENTDHEHIQMSVGSKDDLKFKGKTLTLYM